MVRRGISDRPGGTRPGLPVVAPLAAVLAVLVVLPALLYGAGRLSAPPGASTPRSAS